MDYHICDVRQECIDAFGSEAIQAIAAIVAWSHVRAPREASEHWGEVGLERSGLIRWIRCDGDVLALNEKFPGVTVGLFNNDNGGMKHIEILAGRFRLILSHDPDPETVVPFSDYGRSLVRVNQMSLFEDQPDSSLPPQNYYTAVLFHAKSDKKGEIPYCLEIRFPDGSGAYAASHLNLYRMFPNLLNEDWLLNASLNFAGATAAKEEKINEKALPTLRRASETGTA